MPPVFGPSSPSKARLKSCADTSGSALRPSQIAKSEISGPSRSSSTTTSAPAARSARSASSTLGLGPAHVDPFSRREPVRLHDTRRSGDREPRRGRHAGGGHDLLREGLRALDPSSRCARPEDEEAESAKRVGETEHQRQLGPDHDEIHLERAREAEQPLRVVRANRVALGELAIPGFPGAACSSVSAGDCASFHASACSRPPDPTTRTRTARV